MKVLKKKRYAIFKPVQKYAEILQTVQKFMQIKPGENVLKKTNWKKVKKFVNSSAIFKVPYFNFNNYFKKNFNRDHVSKPTNLT